MAYGVYKSVDEKSIDGKTYTFEILKKDYVGAAGPLLLNERGGAVEWGEKGSGVYEPVLPSYANFLLSGRETALADEIRQAEDDVLRWRIKEGSNVFWVGKILTDIFRGSLDVQKKPFKLRAVDGLGELENIDYSQINSESVVFLVAMILKETGLDLNIRFASNWFTPTMLSSDDPLKKIKFSGNIAFLDDGGEKRSMYEALKIILKRFGLQLKQSAGVWWVIQRDQLVETTFKYFEYDKDGVFVTSVNDYNPAVEIDPNAQHAKRLGGGTKSYLPAYKSVPIRFTPYLNFEKEFGLLFQPEFIVLPLTDWTEVGTTWTVISPDNFHLGTDYMPSDDPPVLPTGYVKQALNSVANGIHRLRFSLVVDVILGGFGAPPGFPGTPENMNLTLYVALKLGDYFLTFDGVDYAWTTTPTGNQELIPLDGGGSSLTFATQPITTPPIPTGGLLEVRIYRPVERSEIFFDSEMLRYDVYYTNGIRPRLAQVELMFGGVDDAETVETVAEDTVAANKVVREADEFTIGDGPTSLSAGKLIVDSELTGDWKKGPYTTEDPTGVSIDEMLARTIISSQKTPVEMHEAIYTKRLNAGAVIEAHQVLEIGSQRFAPVYLKRALLNGHSEGEWAEVKSETSDIETDVAAVIDESGSSGGTSGGGSSPVSADFSQPVVDFTNLAALKARGVKFLDGQRNLTVRSAVLDNALGVTSGGTGLDTLVGPGRLLYSTSVDALATLPIAANHSVLQSNGVNPEWRSTLTLAGNLQVSVTNTYDVGTTTDRWRDLWLSRNATIGGTLGVTGVATFGAFAGTAGTLNLKGNLHIEASGGTGQLRLLHDGTNAFVNAANGNLMLQLAGGAKATLSTTGLSLVDDLIVQGGDVTIGGYVVRQGFNTGRMLYRPTTAIAATLEVMPNTNVGGDASTFSLYATDRVSDGTNYGGFAIDANATRMRFRRFHNGSVTIAERFVFGGIVQPEITNMFDLGETGTRWRDLWLSRNASIAGTLGVTGATTIGAFAGTAGSLNLKGNLHIEASGNTNQLILFHDGTNAYINSTSGQLRLQLAGSAKVRLGSTGLAVVDDLTIEGGDLLSSTASFNLVNATVTTLNFAGAATSITMGATTGSTLLRHQLLIGDQKPIGSQTYVSGWTGSGWQHSYLNSEYLLETDNLSIRGTLSVYELLIQQIRATNGSIYVSATQKVDAIITPTVGAEVVDMEDPAGHDVTYFAPGDLVLVQRVKVTDPATLVKRIVRKVASVSGRRVTFTGATGGPVDTGAVKVGDDYVRIGSETDANRRGSVYLTADDTGAPYIDVVDGVAAWSDFRSPSKTKVRLGNLAGITDADFGGALTGYGIYTLAGYFKGNIFVKSSVAQGLQNDSIQIGNITNSGSVRAIMITQTGTASTSGFFAYDASGSQIFKLALDGTAQISAAYFSATDIWAGNAALGNAATVFVLGDLGSSPKLALGATADAITVAGAEVGFIVNGSGELKAYQNANNFIRMTGGVTTVAASAFNLITSSLVMNSTTPKLALGASAGTLTFSSGDGIYMDGAGDFRAGSGTPFSTGVRWDDSLSLFQVLSNLQIIMSASPSGATISSWVATDTQIQKTDTGLSGYDVRLMTSINASGRPGILVAWGDGTTGPGSGDHYITIGGASYLDTANGPFSSGWDNTGGGLSINVGGKNILFAGRRASGGSGVAFAGWSADDVKFTKGSSSTGFALNTSSTAFLSSTGTGFEVWDAASPKFLIGVKNGLRMSWNTDVAGGLYLGGATAGWKVTATGLENTSASSTITGGIIVGGIFKTSDSGTRVEISGSGDMMRMYDLSNQVGKIQTFTNQLIVTSHTTGQQLYLASHLDLALRGDSGITFADRSGAGTWIEGVEMNDPAAPGANVGKIYFRDNGSGKTQLVVRFNTGAVQVLATQP